MRTTPDTAAVNAETIKAGQSFIVEGTSFTAVTDAEDNYGENIRVSVTKTGGNAMFYRIFSIGEMVQAA